MSDNESDTSESGGPVPLLEADAVVEGKRERKKPKNLLSEVAVRPSTPKKKEQDKGDGTRIGDNPLVEEFLTKHKSAELEYVHRFLFGTAGTKINRKKAIREFCGFPSSMTAEQIEKRKESLAKRHSVAVKFVSQCLDVGATGTKEAIVDAIVAWASDPQPSGRKSLPSKRRSSAKGTPKKKSSKKKKSSASGGKRKASDAAAALANKPSAPLSAFQLYLKDCAADYRKDNPDAGTLETTKAIKAQWAELGADDKQPYEDAHMVEVSNYNDALEQYEKDRKRAASAAAKKKKTASKTKKAASTPKGKKKQQGKTKGTPKRALSSEKIISDSESEDDEEDEEDNVKEEEEEEEATKDEGDDDDDGENEEVKDEDDEEEEDEGDVKEEDDDDDAPLAKRAKKQPPSEEELKNAVFAVLEEHGLEDMTKRKVFEAVSEKYSGVDLSDQKKAINKAVGQYMENQE